MENVASDLKILEMKQNVLRKAFEDLHSQTNSVLLLTLQWKDLEEHLESTRMSLHTKFDEIEGLEKKVSFREKELQSKELKLNESLESKKTELSGIEKLIEERVRELECSLEKNDSIKLLIDENSEELVVKEKQYRAIQRSLLEKEMEIKEKDKELSVIKKSVVERRKILDLIERRIREKHEQAELKKKELESIRGSLKKFHDEIEVKEKKLSEVQKSLDDRTKEFKLVEEQVEARRNSIDECDTEIKTKEEKLSSIGNSIVECLNELHMEENRLGLLHREVQLKEKQFGSLKKSVEDLSKKLEMKEMKFEGVVKDIALKEKQIEEELSLFNGKVNELFKEVESKEKNIDSLKSCLEGRSNELAIKEIQFEKKVKEFESKVNEFYSIAKAVEQNTRKMNSTGKTEQLGYAPTSDKVPSSACNKRCVIRDGKNLQNLLNQHLKRHELVYSEVDDVLRASSDPSKLVLEAMHGFYPEEENQEFDVNIIRRSCILLLEELIKATPQVSPQVKEEAARLAIRWKAKMRVAAENSLEVFGFLQLLAAFGLASIFNIDELRRLFDMVGERRQIPDLRQAMCIADKAPLSAPLKLEPTEHFPLNNENNSSNLQPASSSGRSSPWSVDELSTVNDLSQIDYLAYLQTSPDPAKLVYQLIQGFLSQHWTKGDLVIQPSELTGYILIVDQLTKISPQIGDCVKKDAAEMLCKWRTKMNESSLEVLGFVQFLTTYQLDSLFNEDDTLKFFEMISQCKMAMELCQTLAFSNKAPADFVRKLIRKKKFLEAVRLIFAFKLNDKFSSVQLLKAYLEEAKNTRKNTKFIIQKEKALVEEITALQTVKQYIKDYRLESEFSPKDIDHRIAMLEKNRRQMASSFTAPKVEEQDTGKKRGGSALVHNNQPPQHEHRNKFPRVAESTVRHYPPSAFSPPCPRPSVNFLPTDRGPMYFGGLSRRDYALGPVMFQPKLPYPYEPFPKPY